MVGMTRTSWAIRASGLMKSAKNSGNIASKLENMRQLRDVLLVRDSSLLPEFAPRLSELEAQLPAAARKFLAEILGEIGKKHLELLPEIIPTLITYLKDDSPPVARQAIVSGTSLFFHAFVKVAIQGLNSVEVNETLKSSWTSVLKFKKAAFPLAIQPGVDGTRLLAVKFIEATVLLYTPDPSLPSEPPKEFDGTQFSISWLKGGHPILNVGDLTTEAGQSLRLLLDQLRFPQVKFLNNSMVIVLINSLSAIAKKRPSFYGRILPVLFSLDPDISIIKEIRVPGAHHALRSAFLVCLQCTHSSAAPWRARLVEALRSINGGEPPEQQPPKHEKSLKLQMIRAESSASIKEDKSCKRPLDKGTLEELADGTISEKRIRQSPEAKNFSEAEPFYDSATHSREADSGPVRQLVGMFGALVAQGSKASEPLEILISSISSDLLAEVVITNMRNLPLCSPTVDDDDESSCPTKFGAIGLSTLNSASKDFLLSSTFSSLVTSQLDSPPLSSQDIIAIHAEHKNDGITKDEKVLSEEPPVAPRPPDASSYLFSEMIIAPAQLYENETETPVGKIPGLDSGENFVEFPDTSITFEETKEPTKDYSVSLCASISRDISPSTSTVSHSLETSSHMMAVADGSDTPCMTSHSSFSHCLLPKMATYDIDLSDEQKDRMQKAAFSRIIEAYKEVTVSGDSNVRLSLLAHVGTEFSLDLDPWGLLQKHVVSDYVNHEGHELTLRVLYRLFRETEQDHDFLCSRTATSVYESFLSNVVEALRDAFPATDKSLGRLLGEAPYLSEGSLRMLEGLCLPKSKEKHDAESQNGDRVTQGLSALWSLILLRPLSRDQCLQIVLQSAVYQFEEVRMKAIRLVANKLFPMPSISQKIEIFALEKLNLVLNNATIISLDDVGALESSHILQKEKEMENSSKNGANIESLTYDPSLKCAPSSIFLEAQRCMSLYFALCTKKHSLLRQIFAIYKNIPKAAAELVHLHIPILVRTIGSSPELLGIVLDPPPGSDDLLMQTLQILTDGVVPSQELISSLTTLFKTKTKDIGIYIPILPFISKDEILPLIPQLVNLPLDKFQLALSRILQGSPQACYLLSPAEVLITIHGIDSEKDGIPLKKIMDACSACFEQRHMFTQQVLAKVLNQLVEQIPLPLLFMRTVIQAIGVYPGLVDFVMEILSRLVSKQIWKYPKLWAGFLKCAIQTKPQSFNVLLQLPAAQLENALNKNSVLKPSLVEHANQPNIRSNLPRSTLVVLGLANDAQRLVQVQPTSQNQAPDVSASIADSSPVPR